MGGPSNQNVTPEFQVRRTKPYSPMISFKERIYVAMRRFLLRNRKKGKKKKGEKKESSSKYVLFLKQARLACFANFSGRTVDHPDLLKYSCQVECR